MKNTPVKTLLVLSGFTCNNNCLVCSVGAKRCVWPDRSFTDVEVDLKNGRLDGFREVEFTGGEPTIRKDIIDLVRRAHELGYRKISMSTNGRLFSYGDFTEKIIKAGLNQITFSLLGSSNQVHNAITRTPNSLAEVLAGIKKVQTYPGVTVKASTVVSRVNFQDLKSLAELVIPLGIKHWYILDLIPDGNAKKNYKNLVVNLFELRSEIKKLEIFSNKFIELGFFDFPFCTFTQEMRGLNNVIFVNAKKRGETSEQVGYNPDRIVLDEGRGYIDKHKKHTKICGHCQYHNECGGIWREYLELFGEEEIAELVKANRIKLLDD